VKCKNPLGNDKFCFDDLKVQRVLNHLVFSFHETRTTV